MSRGSNLADVDSLVIMMEKRRRRRRRRRRSTEAVRFASLICKMWEHHAAMKNEQMRFTIQLTVYYYLYCIKVACFSVGQ